MKVKNTLLPEQTSLSSAARRLRVLGHPARLQILHFVEGGEETVTAIQKHLGLTQAMTSQHLKLLHEVGLVERRRQGTSIFYGISPGLGRSLLTGLRGCRELWHAPPVERANQ